MSYYKKIEKDLNLIISLAKMKYEKEIISIFLEGSYGRSEGAFFFKKNVYYPINDYDIVIVIYGERKNEMYLDFKILVEKMLVPRLDVSILNIKKFKKKNHSLARYDLLMNSKIIYGDHKILDILSKFNQNKIPFREKEQLFFSRIISFLLFKYNKNKDKYYNLQQLSKAVISAYESILLQNNRYNSSYNKNRDKLESIDYLNSNEKVLLKLSYKIKLNPSSVDLDIINENDFFKTSYSFVKSHFFKLLKRQSIFLKNSSVYNLYFWLRPKRIIQILLSLVGDKKYFRDLILIKVQLDLFLNDFPIEGKELMNIKKTIEVVSGQKFENTDEVIAYIIKTRMEWE